MGTVNRILAGISIDCLSCPLLVLGRVITVILFSLSEWIDSGMVCNNWPEITFDWHFSVCTAMAIYVMNDCWQRVQIYGFSPVWILKCVLKAFTNLNFLSQIVQLCSFSSLWLFIWMLRSPDWANVRPQISHLNGFNFKWTPFTWIRRCSRRLNLALHWSHECLRSSVWTFVCVRRDEGTWNRQLHERKLDWNDWTEKQNLL